jgi:hypothetical protein
LSFFSQRLEEFVKNEQEEADAKSWPTPTIEVRTNINKNRHHLPISVITSRSVNLPFRQQLKRANLPGLISRII